jgi:transposase-like protein
MNTVCQNPNCAFPQTIIKDGTFRRKEDSKIIQRFRCKNCFKRFSRATLSDAYQQKKRRKNGPLLKLLASGVSMRRSALLLGIHPKTVSRKLIFLAEKSRKKSEKFVKHFSGRVHNVQIDDLITKENSKLKPLSVSIAVDEKRRIILGIEVSQIPAFGTLSQLAQRKYGKRNDEHSQGLERLFEKLTLIVSPEAVITSDEHKKYPHFISRYFPSGRHHTYKSERGCIVGQGELKKVKFDPLFVINHTCALLRANVNRLFRKTWCTTKDPKRLKDHLDIFIYFYNQVILRASLTPI